MLFAEHLKTVFRPHPPQGDEYFQPSYITDESKIKLLQPIEVASMIDRSINARNAPGHDEITGRMLKKLPKKAIVH